MEENIFDNEDDSHSVHDDSEESSEDSDWDANLDVKKKQDIKA